MTKIIAYQLGLVADEGDSVVDVAYVSVISLVIGTVVKVTDGEISASLFTAFILFRFLFI